MCRFSKCLLAIGAITCCFRDLNWILFDLMLFIFSRYTMHIQYKSFIIKKILISAPQIHVSLQPKILWWIQCRFVIIECTTCWFFLMTDALFISQQGSKKHALLLFIIAAWTLFSVFCFVVVQRQSFRFYLSWCNVFHAVLDPFFTLLTQLASSAYC